MLRLPDSALPLPRPVGACTGELARAWALYRSGRIRQAVAELTQLSRAAADGGLALTQAESCELALLTLGGRLALGDIAAAGTAGDDLAPHLAGAGRAAMLAHLGRAELAAALGDHETALHGYTTAGGLPGSDAPALGPWRAGAAVALLRLGRRKEAAALAHELVGIAEVSLDPYLLAVALRTLATADAASDPFGSLRRARELARAVPDQRLAAQVDTDLAGLLLLVPAGDTVGQAVDLLRAAEEYASGEGLWPLHSRVARMLERAGERARPLEGEALALLTDAEQRVARLAAQGLTNRQIAEQLTVTVKGVEWHLSRVYRKLGIASRSHLGGLLDAGTPPRPRPARA